MANGIRTGDPRGLNKGRSSKFREGSRVRQTPEEGQRTYRPKRCGNNNKDEDNSPKILNDKRKISVLIDMPLPIYNNISIKEYNKMNKYKDLKIEMETMWHLKNYYRKR